MLVYQQENYENERVDIGEWLGFLHGGDACGAWGGVGHECMTTAEIGPRGLQKGHPDGMGFLELALRIIGMRYVVWLHMSMGRGWGRGDELHHCMATEAPLCE